MELPFIQFSHKTTWRMTMAAFWAFLASFGEPISNSGFRLPPTTNGTLNFLFKEAFTQIRFRTSHREAVHPKPTSKL